MAKNAVIWTTNFLNREKKFPQTASGRLDLFSCLTFKDYPFIEDKQLQVVLILKEVTISGKIMQFLESKFFMAGLR